MDRWNYWENGYQYTCEECEGCEECMPPQEEECEGCDQCVPQHKEVFTDEYGSPIVEVVEVTIRQPRAIVRIPRPRPQRPALRR